MVKNTSPELKYCNLNCRALLFSSLKITKCVFFLINLFQTIFTFPNWSQKHTLCWNTTNAALLLLCQAMAYKLWHIPYFRLHKLPLVVGEINVNVITFKRLANTNTLWLLFVCCDHKPVKTLLIFSWLFS